MEYVVANVCEYLPERHSFDLALISYVHPEPPDRDAMLAAAASAVAPGGQLLVLALGLSEHMGTGGPDPERRYTPERISPAPSPGSSCPAARRSRARSRPTRDRGWQSMCWPGGGVRMGARRLRSASAQRGLGLRQHRSSAERLGRTAPGGSSAS
ncbi:MAG: hypothetical protein ACREX8_10045 [Gammaproteobacteria bacterium]